MASWLDGLMAAAAAVLPLSAAASFGSTPGVFVELLVADTAGASIAESSTRMMGNAVVLRQRPPAATSPGAAGTTAERVFLDTSLCFNRSVRLMSLEFFVDDVTPLHAGAFRWQILHPIPSHHAAPTQWFRLAEAWPLAETEKPVTDAYPVPGAYRLSLRPAGKQLGHADCIGWSLKGPGSGPLSYQEDETGHSQVAWASSSGGLHDATELYVKRGARPAPHIDWTGLESRTYSLRLRYVEDDTPVTEAAPPVRRRTGAPKKVVEGGNPACWKAGYTFEKCCVVLPDAVNDTDADGNPDCWDNFFNFERCCTLTAEQRAEKISFAPPETPHYELPHLFRGNLPRLGPVQDDEALLLYSLVRVMRPRTILEFGTSNGFSSINWLYAIADDPEARVFSYDILPYPNALLLEDADPRFVFVQKSQADFDPADIDGRPVDIAFFDAGHLVEYSVKAFERVVEFSLSPQAIVAVHDTGLHVLDYGSGAPADEEGLPFSEESCALRPGGATLCRRFEGCQGMDERHGYCVARAHRPSERQFVDEVLRRWPEFRPMHLHSRRVFRHGLTLLQRGVLWDPDKGAGGDF